MWSSTVSGTPLSSSRGKWSRTAGALIAPSLAKVTTCAEPPAATTSLRKALTVGVGLDTWPSDMSAVVGRRVLEPEQKAAGGRKGSGDEQDSKQARERERDDESKCEHDRRGSRKQSFERAGLRQEMR